MVTIHLPFNTFTDLEKAFMSGCPHFVVFGFADSIWRIKEPDGVGAVVVFEEAVVGEVFDIHFIHAFGEGFAFLG